MSDLDDLEEFAETAAFGFRSLPSYSGRPSANKKAYGETCAKGHARTGTNVIYRKSRGRVDVQCRICRRENEEKRNLARRLLRACSKQEPSR